MSVAKREISLAEALGLYLSYTPGYEETEQFRTDLRTLNHTLLRDSITECVASSKAPTWALNNTKRQAIHRVYNRKVKELAALYPFLFAVESAMRATAFELYGNAFGNLRWWNIFIQTYNNGHDERHFPRAGSIKRRVSNTDVTPTFIREMLFSISCFSRKQMAVLSDPSCKDEQFLEEVTLRHLFNIMEADWGLCSLGSLHKTDFQRHKVVICDARNELFHGNPIKSRSSVFKACERILDAVNMHIGDLDLALRDTAFQRPTPSIVREPRHCTPPL